MTSPQMSPHSFFFAYPGRPSLRAETLRQGAAAAADSGTMVETWEDLRVDGRLIIDGILEAINRRDALLAEVSSINPNVMFEVGYAVARGKSVYLAIDETDEEAHRAWQSLALTDTIGRIEYGGNARVLARKVSDLSVEPAPPLIESLISGAREREANAVFAPTVPHKFTAAERLERFLERQTHLKLLAAYDELGTGNLSYYASQIYRSSAAILHFMKPSRLTSAVYNGRLALLAGIVKGLDLPLLMIAEDGYESPLDYKDLLFVYKTTAKLTDHVSSWLTNLPSPPGSNKRLGRLKLDIELPLRTFGQYVAESEKESLTNYFVQTNEFESVISGRASVFVGRKGTGKTATMQQAIEELRLDRRILVVPIKPSSYDLSGLLNLLSRFDDPSRREYLLVNLWSFLLASEVALRAITHAEDLPAGIGGDQATVDLAETLNAMDIDPSSDLSGRLDEVISATLGASAQNTDNFADAAESLRSAWLVRLLPKLRPALRRYDRVAVLVDNLDKTWQRGVDFESLSHFLLSLFVTSGKLKSEFAKARNGASRVDMSMTIFLRTDIYDVMSGYAREADKINPQSIQWQDEELLIRVLEERYAANQIKRSAEPLSLWTEVFSSEVHGLPARDYFLWRALRRPRDLIFLGNAALTTAINRRHSSVLAQDFIHAEETYSRFAVEALLVESGAQGFDLESALFALAGLDSTIVEEDLNEALLDGIGDPVEVKNWLIRTSFLGLETRDGRFVHVEGDAEARKKQTAAKRLAERLDRPLRYRVHPAFRPYLDIRDDDVHVGSQNG